MPVQLIASKLPHCHGVILFFFFFYWFFVSFVFDVGLNVFFPGFKFLADPLVLFSIVSVLFYFKSLYPPPPPPPCCPYVHVLFPFNKRYLPPCMFTSIIFSVLHFSFLNLKS